MAKPNWTIVAATSGRTAPREPNWARDWIICGSPIRGPWAPWKAWNRVPKTLPTTIATIVHGRLRPESGPRAPVAAVRNDALIMNQSWVCDSRLPLRSVSGT